MIFYQRSNDTFSTSCARRAGRTRLLFCCFPLEESRLASSASEREVDFIFCSLDAPRCWERLLVLLCIHLPCKQRGLIQAKRPGRSLSDKKLVCSVSDGQRKLGSASADRFPDADTFYRLPRNLNFPENTGENEPWRGMNAPSLLLN